MITQTHRKKTVKSTKKQVYPKFLFLKFFFFLKSKWLQGVCELKILYTMPGTGRRKKNNKKVVLYAEPPAKTV